MKKSFFVVVIFFLAAASVSLPFLKPGLHLIHDDQQIARLFVFDQALKSGQFPVRWVDGLGFGFGYPLFVFYPPFVYMLGELFHLLGFGFIDSVKLVFFVSIFASGLAMYVLAREFWGRLAATVGALFYIFVPYRALDIYVRGALAESFSFVWLPLIFWSFYKLSRAKSPRYWLSSLHKRAEHFPSTRKYVFAFRIRPSSQTRRRSASEYKLFKTNKTTYVYLSAIFLALLMITHNLIFLPFMLILPFYLLFLFVNSKDKRLITYHFSLITLIAAGLSAFFWMPAIFEKKFTIIDQLLLVSLANYNIHFVYPQQLWNWPWGFGGSAAGLTDGISFKIGKLHVLASVGAFVLGVILCVRNFRSKLSTVNCQLSTVFFTLFLFSALMTTFYSKPIWDLIPPLDYLQFPWRFLIFTAFFSSFLAAAFIFSLRLPILKLTTSFLLLILLVIPNFKLFKPQAYRPNLTDEKATSKEKVNWDISQSSFEYLPKGVQMYVSELGTNLVDIKKEEIPKQKLEILSGIAKVENFEAKPSKINFTIDAKDNVLVRINTFNFPGWQVHVDNQKAKIDDNNKFKLITFQIPKGTHQVKIEFKNTPLIWVANLITIITIIFICGMFILRPKWRSFLIVPGRFSTSSNNN